MLKKINNQDKYDLTLKFIIIGDKNIGKTTILNNYLSDNKNISQTIGCEIKNISIEYKTKKINIQIWDTPGIEKYRTNKNNIYKNTKGIILMYNSNDENSFINIKEYLIEINKYKTENIPIVLFSIKNEKYNIISDELGILMGEEINCKFIMHQKNAFELALIYLCEKYIQN